jgi:hypothetical protein
VAEWQRKAGVTGVLLFEKATRPKQIDSRQHFVDMQMHVRMNFGLILCDESRCLEAGEPVVQADG